MFSDTTFSDTLLDSSENKVIHVAGTSHEPFASRVEQLKSASQEDHSIELVQDHNNPFDDSAISVVVDSVGQIGYGHKKDKNDIVGWKPVMYNITTHNGYNRVDLLLTQDV